MYGIGDLAKFKNGFLDRPPPPSPNLDTHGTVRKDAVVVSFRSCPNAENGRHLSLLTSYKTTKRYISAPTLKPQTRQRRVRQLKLWRRGMVVGDLTSSPELFPVATLAATPSNQHQGLI
ncbi:hypothetical protein Bbelb_145320 [Branchiostoma belcheri]|nr:hypothetical protein Bbelb_145320 [Branchiostoma belcheri]